MKRLEPVIWAKGPFLTPQHLQLQDRLLENMLQFHLGALAFRPWGFRQLQVNQELLAAGTFALSHASGIFPDGLLFDIPNSGPRRRPSCWRSCWVPTMPRFPCIWRFRNIASVD
jgi:type VI secretion system protein ImpJ